MLRSAIIYSLFAIAIAGQVMFWSRTHDVLPDMSVVPDVPGTDTVKALSFGDESAFFRLLGLKIQNAGDTYGRFTALYKYDYSKLYHWFRLLDNLDDSSNYVPSMATYYYGQTQKSDDVKYIVDYLLEHAAHRPKEKWWWLVQASYLANHKLKDKQLALEAVLPLADVEGIPLWARQMPAFIFEQEGEIESALKIIQGIMDTADEVSQGEVNFMRHFIDERLQRMETLQGEFEAFEQKNAKPLQAPATPDVSTAAEPQ